MPNWSDLWCAHQYVRRFGGGRMWLECSECTQRTPGITNPPTMAPARRLDPRADDNDAAEGFVSQCSLVETDSPAG
jgi:hypothetical protein